jgi:hypothetical protein
LIKTFKITKLRTKQRDVGEFGDGLACGDGDGAGVVVHGGDALGLALSRRSTVYGHLADDTIGRRPGVTDPD